MSFAPMEPRQDHGAGAKRAEVESAFIMENAVSRGGDTVNGFREGMRG